MATARVERRLAAILAADVVRLPRLVEQDETATLSALHDLRREVIDPLLAEHHGRIVGLMGDGPRREFGSVVDAVACAIALQKGLAQPQINALADRRIVFRNGINLGDVVVEGDDLLGDGVNIAARLEQICPRGDDLRYRFMTTRWANSIFSSIRWRAAGQEHRPANPSVSGRSWSD